MLFRRHQLTCAILSTCSAAAFAQGTTSGDRAVENSGPIETIVVTASGFEQKLVDAPASVSVISREALQSKPFTGLADALRDIKGIDVGSGQDKNGNISVTMRGLPADYTLVLIDGRRQSDVGDIGPNNFGNSQFMYMPPLEAIERIEVVRGPMSTLYGADAIGGVINVITRKQLDRTQGSITLSSNMQQDDQYGDDTKADLYLTGPLGVDGLTYALRGGIYDREESEPTYADNLPLPNGDTWSDAGSFGDKKIVAAKNWNTGLSLNYALNNFHALSLEYDIAKQRYDNTQGQTGTLDGTESLWRASGGVVQPRVGYTPYQRVEREQFVLAHVGRWEFGTSTAALTQSSSENLGRSLPLTVQERTQLQGIWNQAVLDQGNNRPILTEALESQLAQQFLPRPLRSLRIENLILDTKLESQWQQHYFILGGQYFNAEMEDGVFGMYGDGFRNGTTQPHRQWALFGEDNWELNENMTLTLGARYDDHNIFGDQISPRAYLRVQPSDSWTLKGGVSTGYKTPKPNQLFPGITGFGAQGVFPFVGTPDLQPETSINYEVAAYYTGPGRLRGNITFFYNDFKDKIINQDSLPNCELVAAGQPCVDIGPGWAALGYNQFSQAANVDQSETRGLELAADLEVTDRINLSANYSYTDSEVKSGRDQGLPLVNTPKNMINATLSWQLLDNLSLALISEIRGERFRGTADISGPSGPETTKLYYKSYELLHLGARYAFNESLTFNARVNNLLDQDLSSRTCLLAATEDRYNCTADYNTTEKARSFWVSASFKF